MAWNRNRGFIQSSLTDQVTETGTEESYKGLLLTETGTEALSTISRIMNFHNYETKMFNNFNI